MTECIDPSENFPYTDQTFALVRRISHFVHKHSRRLSVPPVAVAGSIADEFNTREGVRAFFDWMQDYVVLRSLPDCFIA